MSTNNSFINEYGEDAFYCVFDSLSSYVNSRSQLIQKEYHDMHDMHYLQCTGCCLLDGKVIVIVEDSIDRGSQILEYGDEGVDRGVAYLLPVHPDGAVAGGHSATGQDSGWNPGADRLLEGEAVLRTGRGGIHVPVPAATGSQALQLCLGRWRDGQQNADSPQ